MILTQLELKSLEKKVSPLLINAGKFIMANWESNHKLNYKDKRDFASEIDIKVENSLRKNLHKLLPQAGYIVEEGKTQKLFHYNWLIDPIDGTKYYVNKAPMFLTQIALIKNDIPVLGQVYNPVSNQLFSASLNNGARLNGQKIFDKTRKRLDESIIDIDFGSHDEELSWKLKILSSLANVFYRIRITGNYLFIYLATGAIDASVNLHKDTKLVDIMPAIIILKEAGLIADFVKINKNRNILIGANKKIYEHIKKIIFSFPF
jgi:myo-inositol-1(or 4)-monophosphatase